MQALAVVVLIGLVIAAAGWAWLIVRAFQQRLWWGIGSLSLPPLALLFALRHAQRAIAPVVLFMIGMIAAAIPAIYSALLPVDLGLRQGLSEWQNALPLAGKMLQSDTAHDWMVAKAFYMQLGGLAIALLAWVWLIIRAFRTRRGWGFTSLVVPPVCLVFAARSPRKGIPPLSLVLLSL